MGSSERGVRDISGLTLGIGWCTPQQGACKFTLNVKDSSIQESNFYSKIQTNNFIFDISHSRFYFLLFGKYYFFCLA